jgi:hypothetical protein
MIFLPGGCERCPNIALISSTDCIGGQTLCGSCGGLVSIVPGPAYSEGDVLLFNELLGLVESVGLVGIEAQELAMAIEDARSSLDEQKALGLVSAQMPALAPLAPLLAASRGRARQALSMLDTILRARSTERKHSGILPGPTRARAATPSTGTARREEGEPLARAVGSSQSSR